jgi:hypothetical protein
MITQREIKKMVNVGARAVRARETAEPVVNNIRARLAAGEPVQEGRYTAELEPRTNRAGFKVRVNDKTLVAA